MASGLGLFAQFRTNSTVETVEDLNSKTHSTIVLVKLQRRALLLSTIHHISSFIVGHFRFITLSLSS